MSTVELKNKIYSLVENINDNDMLQAIITLLNRSDKSTSTDWWDELSEKDKENIEIGLKQADDKQFVSNKDVRSRIDNFFQKHA